MSPEEAEAFARTTLDLGSSASLGPACGGPPADSEFRIPVSRFSRRDPAAGVERSVARCELVIDASKVTLEDITPSNITARPDNPAIWT